MNTFVLKRPVQAARYTRNDNEQEVMNVIAVTGRSGTSMNNMQGYLHVYNGGPELDIDDGAWVVAIGGDVAVLSNEQFTELFRPV